MPRIPEVLLDTVVYIYPSVPTALAGEKVGGSGFLISMPSKRFDATFQYAVTNRHVVESGNTVIRLNTQSGDMDVLDFDERNWIFHPEGDDLAIASFPSLDRKLFKYQSIGIEDFLTMEISSKYNVGAGDDTLVIGRFINQEGKQKNTPTVRFGNLSQTTTAKINLSRGFGYFPQESFLVEARSISGYSGSPVILDVAQHDRRLRADQYYLLGVQWGYINDWTSLCDQTGTPINTGHQVKLNTGMMGVIPAWKIQTLLDLPEIQARRLSSEENFAKRKGISIATVQSQKTNDPL